MSGKIVSFERAAARAHGTPAVTGRDMCEEETRALGAIVGHEFKVLG